MPSPAFLQPLLVGELTAFVRRIFVLRHVGWALWALLVGLLFTYVPDARPIAINQLPVWKDGTNQFRTLAAYLVGGFTLKAVSAWYQRRTNYASLCGATRDLLVQLGSLLPRPASSGFATADTAVGETRRAMGRWPVLAHELAVLKGRGAMDDPKAEAYLVSAGLLAHGEWEAMVGGDRHTTVLFWIQTRTKQLVESGQLLPQELILIANSISHFRSQANDLMSSLNRDLPYPYASLVALLVNCTILFFATTDGLNLATNFGAESGTAHASTWVMQISCTFCLTCCYGAFIELQDVLHNPFGDRRVDVAHDTIAAGLRNLADSIVSDANGALPPELIKHSSDFDHSSEHFHTEPRHTRGVSMNE